MDLVKFSNTLFLFVIFCTKLSNSLLHFPPNSAHGIFAALAIPLELPNRSVFYSYNFEANYNLPGKASDFTSLPPQWEEESRSGKLENNKINSTLYNNTSESNNNKDNSNRVKRSFISRRIMYKMLMDKFNHGGLSGESCLLKLICETNESHIGDHNGILGHILHIVFSPTTSVNENLSQRFYDAELDGLGNNCNLYTKNCPHKMLDLISKSF